MYVIKTGLLFDPDKLANEYAEAEQKWGNLFYKGTALSLRMRKGDDNLHALKYGAGPLVGSDGLYFERESSFNSYNPLLECTYTQDVLREVERYAALDGIKIGRAAYRVLKSATCLHWHRDYDNLIRYHIPVITNSACMFLHNKQLSQMDHRGALYTLDPHVPHTAINASRVSRVHIVLIGYTDETAAEDMSEAKDVFYD
jgi:hypothetical protein